jgi:phosphoenolpyruvate-protein kinase (PTS system EI component)
MQHALALSGETPPADLFTDFPAGVGLLRGEYLLREAGAYWGLPEVRETVTGYLAAVAGLTARPVWYRTSDLEAAEAATLRGAEEGVVDPVPQLGMRGIRRSLRFPDTFRRELAAFAAAQDRAANLRLMFPFVSTVKEARACLTAARAAGVRGPVGLMAETPAAVLTLPELLDVGYAHVVVGCNDLWSLTMARANVAGVYPTATTALARMMELARKATAEAGAALYVAGYLDPSLVRLAAEHGADAAVFHYSQLPKLLGGQYAGLPQLDHLAAVKKRTRAAVAAMAG